MGVLEEVDNVISDDNTGLSLKEVESHFVLSNMGELYIWMQIKAICPWRRERGKGKKEKKKLKREKQRCPKVAALCVDRWTFPRFIYGAKNGKKFPTQGGKKKQAIKMATGTKEAGGRLGDLAE